MQQTSNAIAMCAVACACALSACAQAPRSALPPPGARDAALPDAGQPAAQVTTQAITLQGQLGIKLGPWGAEPPRGASFGFFFQGTPQAGELSLMTPLGSQVAQVSWRPDAATLQRIGPGGGDLVQRDSIDDLAAEALGEAVPLRTLIHWMQGRPAPDLPHASLPDAAGFQQSGWSVDTRELAQGRIVAHRHGLPGLRDARIVVRLDP